MKKETIEKYISDFAPLIAQDSAKGGRANLERTLVFLIKEVERDTRHAASELANRLCNDIRNLNQ